VEMAVSCHITVVKAVVLLVHRYLSLYINKKISFS
jgi:hypothetical protein